MNSFSPGPVVIYIMFGFSILILLVLFFYLILFFKLKNNNLKRYTSKFQFGILITLLLCNFIFQITNFVLQISSNLFINLFTNNETSQYSLMISLFIMGFLTLLLLILYIYLGIEYLAVAMDEKIIYFVSQKINYSQIVNIDINDKYITINYLEKERFKKKLKFFKTNEIAKFIIEQDEVSFKIKANDKEEGNM